MSKREFVVLCIIYLTGIVLAFMSIFFVLFPESNKENVNIISVERVQPIVMDTYKMVIPTQEITQIPSEEELVAEEINNIEYEVGSLEWFVEYKDICKKYEDTLGLPDDIYSEFSENEILQMQRVVETETHGADFVSKTHVAFVILNRLNSDVFPNSIEGVIVPGQFSTARNDITESTILAVEYAYMFPDTTKGALFFHSGRRTETFCGRELIFEDAVGHYFY